MDKYLINLGFINITWYAFFIVSSMLIGAIIILKNKKIATTLNKEELYDYLFYLVIFSIIGARTWYVLFSFDYYFAHPAEIIAIWNGGLAIHGGILAGMLYTVYFCKKKEISIFLLTDALAMPLLLGQAIGRWGNFINQEAHGPETTKKFLENTLHLPMFIVNGMNINGVYYQPTFLYESLWNFGGFLLILFVIRKIVKDEEGYITAFYFIWYGLIRSILEQFRTDALFFFGIRIAQLTSVIMIILGFSLLIFLTLRKKKQINESSIK